MQPKLSKRALESSLLIAEYFTRAWLHFQSAAALVTDFHAKRRELTQLDNTAPAALIQLLCQSSSLCASLDCVQAYRDSLDGETLSDVARNPDYSDTDVQRRRVELLILHFLGFIILESGSQRIIAFMSESTHRDRALARIRLCWRQTTLDELEPMVPSDAPHEPPAPDEACDAFAALLARVLQGQEIGPPDLASLQPIRFALTSPLAKITRHDEPQGTKRRRPETELSASSVGENKRVIRLVLIFVLGPHCHSFMLSRVAGKWAPEIQKDDALEGVSLAFKLLQQLGLATPSTQGATFTLCKPASPGDATLDSALELLGIHEQSARERYQQRLNARTETRSNTPEPSEITAALALCGDNLRALSHA